MTRPKRNAHPDTTSPRVSRGGCWLVSVPAGVRASFRDTLAPAYRYDSIGFRCALRGRVKR